NHSWWCDEWCLALRITYCLVLRRHSHHDGGVSRADLDLFRLFFCSVGGLEKSLCSGSWWVWFRYCHLPFRRGSRMGGGGGRAGCAFSGGSSVRFLGDEVVLWW
ncbi:hypothetical protein A2U01_0047971, partial [Trifolium medium]|nr:hypothetical protein [Trifolium medium]